MSQSLTRNNSTSDQLVSTLISALPAMVSGSLGPASPQILGAGKFLLENLPAIVEAGGSILGGRRPPQPQESAFNGFKGFSKSTIPLVGMAAVGAGLAKIGLSLLERRLQKNKKKTPHHSSDRTDPLRGISSRSKPRMKSQGGRPERPPGSCGGAASNLNQLVTLFPHMETTQLENILTVHDGNLEASIDAVLGQTTDCPTPVDQSWTFLYPPLPARVLTGGQSPQGETGEVSPSSPLPPCPVCPVCYTSLLDKRIYQCGEGHSLCHQCRDKIQVRNCPTCRGKLVGRATNMEQLLRSVYGGN